MVVHHYKSECHAKDLFAIFKVEVTARAHKIKVQRGLVKSK